MVVSKKMIQQDDIKWKKWDTMKPGDRHVHEKTMPCLDDSRWIRYHKAHYVTRPYWEYSSSKWEQSYPDMYELLFHSLKHKSEVTFLELGVYTGESIRYFRDFFTHPDAKIVGFDHKPCEFYGADWNNHGSSYSGNTHNVVFYQGDQENQSDLEDVAAVHGPFDVIMDDANHNPQLTEDVFHSLWDSLKEGGLYLIEDIAENNIIHLLSEVVIKCEGKGFYARIAGFGPDKMAVSGGCLVLIKTKDRITGLDEVLVED